MCTIRKYLKTASDLSIPLQMMNPTVDLQVKESKFIKDILHEATVGYRCPNVENLSLKIWSTLSETKGHLFHYKTTSTPS